MLNPNYHKEHPLREWQKIVPVPFLIIEAAEQGLVNTALVQHTYPLKDIYRFCHDTAAAEVEAMQGMEGDQKLQASIRCLLAASVYYIIEKKLEEPQKSLMDEYRIKTSQIQILGPVENLNTMTPEQWLNNFQKAFNLTPEHIVDMQDAYKTLTQLSIDYMRATIRTIGTIPVWSEMLKAVAQLN